MSTGGLKIQFLAAPALIYMDLIVKPECLSKFVLTQPRGTHVAPTWQPFVAYTWHTVSPRRGAWPTFIII